MSCEETQKLIVEFLEGELDEAERKRVQAHIEACDSCAAELEAFQRTMTLLEDDGYVEPEPFYWTRFEAGLRAKLRDRSRRFSLVPRFENVVPRLAPIAVAVLFFCVGLGVGIQPVLSLADRSESGPTYAERVDYTTPVISPRAKSLVEGGLEHDMPTYMADSGDTLTPESFDTAVEQPRIRLATDEGWPATQSGMSSGLLRE
jgi:anti-sigma factor RsiW